MSSGTRKYWEAEESFAVDEPETKNTNICKTCTLFKICDQNNWQNCTEYQPIPETKDTNPKDVLGIKKENIMNKQIPVSHKDYMLLSDALDEHSRTLMSEKGEEYSIDNDFLCMENRLAGMLGETPEFVSLVMAGKHITALGIILEKNEVTEIKLEKLDERIRDATNLLKITSAFIHAKQNDFSLHLGKEEKQDE